MSCPISLALSAHFTQELTAFSKSPDPTWFNSRRNLFVIATTNSLLKLFFLLVSVPISHSSFFQISRNQPVGCTGNAPLVSSHIDLDGQRKRAAHVFSPLVSSRISFKRSRAGSKWGNVFYPLGNEWGNVFSPLVSSRFSFRRSKKTSLPTRFIAHRFRRPKKQTASRSFRNKEL